MLHLGKNTTSRIISKGIAAGHSQQHLSRTGHGAPPRHGRAQFHQLRLAADRRPVRRAHGALYRGRRIPSAVFEHEATTSKISEDMLFYCRQRGLSAEEATALVVNGFVKDVLQQLPMEFAVEAQKLISVSLEGSVG